MGVINGELTCFSPIPGNKNADQAAKATLDEDISTTERYPPDDLKKWLTEEVLKKRMPRKEHKWQYPDSELGIRGPPTA
jgi:hypothetical protein